MKAWIGRWLMGVSIIHTLLSTFVFAKVFQSIFQRGLFDTVGVDSSVGIAVWCALFGVALFICGLAISVLEQTSPGGALPKSLGLALFTLSTIGVVLMPASGFWLAFPPAIAILARKPDASLAAGI
ncbi:MAG: molecular chaperone GroEL [Gallionellaceae bacterium]|nr:MAG: molecular chaperone GroEL [Gallionellaceae bacterium]